MKQSSPELSADTFNLWWLMVMAKPKANVRDERMRKRAAKAAWDERQGEMDRVTDRLMDMHEEMQEQYEAELSRLEQAPNREALRELVNAFWAHNVAVTDRDGEGLPAAHDRLMAALKYAKEVLDPHGHSFE